MTAMDPKITAVLEAIQAKARMMEEINNLIKAHVKTHHHHIAALEELEKRIQALEDRNEIVKGGF